MVLAYLLHDGLRFKTMITVLSLSEDTTAAFFWTTLKNFDAWSSLRHGAIPKPLCAGHKSLCTLAKEWSLTGDSVSYPMVGDLLRELGYSLQANRKMMEGRDHDTANFAVETIRRSWNTMGKQRYPAASALACSASAQS